MKSMASPPCRDCSQDHACWVCRMRLLLDSLLGLCPYHWIRTGFVYSDVDKATPKPLDQVIHADLT